MSDSVRVLADRTPQRIVCLTEEPTEILYLLGEQHRIVGISAYTVRPADARRDKPVVSAFTGGSVAKITALAPDLVIGFSDVQADLAHQLIKANLQVLILNQRSLEDILGVIILIGNIVGAADRAQTLVQDFAAQLAAARCRAAGRAHRPRVYFEEWPEPQICGIQWVSELIAAAGGEDVFAARASGKRAEQRRVTADEVVAANPDVILASWCGKPFEPEEMRIRPGFSGVQAVLTGRVHEIDPSIILQPGPACLTDGLRTLESLLALPR